jgi:hypothetical protein
VCAKQQLLKFVNCLEQRAAAASVVAREEYATCVSLFQKVQFTPPFDEEQSGVFARIGTPNRVHHCLANRPSLCKREPN